MGIRDRSSKRRKRIVAHRASSFQDAEKWDLDFWQRQTPIEAIEEKKDVVHDLLVEALEDVAMIRAIQEGESSESVGREEIVKILEG